MKSTVSKRSESARGFPRLMANFGAPGGPNIVIFAISRNHNRNYVGFVVSVLKPDTAFELGYRSDEWSGTVFEDYPGVVTLEND